MALVVAVPAWLSATALVVARMHPEATAGATVSLLAIGLAMAGIPGLGPFVALFLAAVCAKQGAIVHVPHGDDVPLRTSGPHLLQLCLTGLLLHLLYAVVGGMTLGEMLVWAAHFLPEE